MATDDQETTTKVNENERKMKNSTPAVLKTHEPMATKFGVGDDGHVTYFLQFCHFLHISGTVEARETSNLTCRLMAMGSITKKINKHYIRGPVKLKISNLTRGLTTTSSNEQNEN